MNRFIPMFLTAGLLLAAPAAASQMLIFGVTGIPGQPAPQLSLNGGATVIPVGSYPSATTGWYAEDGYHNSFNPNYATGDTGSYVINDYFVFDLSGVSGPITSAELDIYDPWNGFYAPGPVQLSIYDVTSDITKLMAMHVFNLGHYDYLRFNDLDSGILYGTQTVTSADVAMYVPVTLNAAALAELNAKAGGRIAFGGTLFPGLSGTPAVVPEPLPLAVMAAGFALMGLWRNGRRRIASAFMHMQLRR